MKAAEKQLAAIDAAGGDITKVPLNREEEARLAHLEGIVEVGLQTFVEVGRAFAAIRAGQLYRQTHSTFAAYVKDRFGLSPSYAYRKMDAAEVAAIVSPIGDIANEAQARELVGLEPEQAREVYQRAVAETAGRPTAKAIGNARQEIIPRRRPLPDAFLNATLALDRKVDTMARLVADDRFRSHRQVLREGYGSDVVRAVNELAKVVRALGLGELVFTPAQATLDLAVPE